MTPKVVSVDDAYWLYSRARFTYYSFNFKCSVLKNRNRKY